MSGHRSGAPKAGRTIHARTAQGKCVVQYRHLGEWFLEPAILGATSRVRISRDRAVEIAARPDSTVVPSRPAGETFIGLVDAMRERVATDRAA